MWFRLYEYVLYGPRPNTHYDHCNQNVVAKQRLSI